MKKPNLKEEFFLWLLFIFFMALTTFLALRYGGGPQVAVSETLPAYIERGN